jgi:hypothetical protein
VLHGFERAPLSAIGRAALRGFPQPSIARIAGASGRRFPTSQTPAAERFRHSGRSWRPAAETLLLPFRSSTVSPARSSRRDCCFTPIAAATPWLLLEHGRGSATISALTRWRTRRAASRSSPRAVSRGAPGLPRLGIACSPINWILASASPTWTPPFGRSRKSEYDASELQPTAASSACACRRTGSQLAILPSLLPAQRRAVRNHEAQFLLFARNQGSHPGVQNPGDAEACPCTNSCPAGAPDVLAPARSPSTTGLRLSVAPRR